jgi:hypothetical protein
MDPVGTPPKLEEKIGKPLTSRCAGAIMARPHPFGGDPVQLNPASLAALSNLGVRFFLVLAVLLGLAVLQAVLGVLLQSLRSSS